MDGVYIKKDDAAKTIIAHYRVGQDIIDVPQLILTDAVNFAQKHPKDKRWEQMERFINEKMRDFKKKDNLFNRNRGFFEELNKEVDDFFNF